MIAEVVIIGGGMVGSSVAYHLAAGGCTEVLVIERAGNGQRFPVNTVTEEAAEAPITVVVNWTAGWKR